MDGISENWFVVIRKEPTAKVSVIIDYKYQKRTNS